jgi:phospholipid/cholesterol/gamma-HCH transport system ATP-binding protein
VCVILGGSGCGKSTFLKNMIGLYTPLAGEVWIEDGNLVAARDDERLVLLRKFWRHVADFMRSFIHTFPSLFRCW